ncbi:MAG: D-lyxose ketol-isomerase [Planctomycetes bacterium ADurb.Bin126]|nr:MAG: D-lyxose ketol-isomerase [Planctomycetes bacterium ADurb.Bin126]HOD82800.1 hypothetical protein [Phycisphaerae bacterium]HQL75227.1 hypothetical protein [Phycisphaerae bacterium]
MFARRLALSYGLLALVSAALLLAPGCSIGPKGHPPRGKIVFVNSDFYDKSGKFKVDAAKEAYLDFLKYHDYPVSDNLEKNLFVTDFGLGRFSEVGMGGVMWVNDEKFGYSAMELFLLPNQMVPEHMHVKAGAVPARAQTVHVRKGKTFIYTEGEPAEKIWVTPPSIELNFITVRLQNKMEVGDTLELPPMKKHWMQSAPEGVIATEYQTFAAPDSTKFTDPKAVR